MLVKKYEYPKLQRVMIDGKRRYTYNGSDPVPSVTTILDRTADKSHLIKWRQRIGEDAAKQQTQEAAGFGTMVHNSLEKYTLGEEWEITGNNFVHNMARRAADKMILEGFPHISELWGVEVGLMANSIYAGTTDAVGVFDGKPSIVDFKTAKKIKKREWITDYFLQGILYAEAHNMMFGTSIQQVAILMVDRESNYEEFIISGDEYRHYYNQAMNRIAQYYNISLD